MTIAAEPLARVHKVEHGRLRGCDRRRSAQPEGYRSRQGCNCVSSHFSYSSAYRSTDLVAVDWISAALAPSIGSLGTAATAPSSMSPDVKISVL
jgi:hypothetical protein